jgi:hypothetical protein
MSVIPAVGRLRKEDQELQVSLDFVARICPNVIPATKETEVRRIRV